MRRISIITIIFILLFSGAAHGFKIGAFGGYNIYLNDAPGNTTKGGIAFGGTMAWNLIVMDIGLLSGYFPIYSSYVARLDSYGKEYDVYAYTIPALAYSKIGLGPIYLMGGLGVYYNKSCNMNDTYHSLDFGFAIGGGYKMGLGIIGINIGVLYHNISTDGSGISMLTLLGGIELGF